MKSLKKGKKNKLSTSTFEKKIIYFGLKILTMQ